MSAEPTLNAVSATVNAWPAGVTATCKGRTASTQPTATPTPTATPLTRCASKHSKQTRYVPPVINATWAWSASLIATWRQQADARSTSHWLLALVSEKKHIQRIMISET